MADPLASDLKQRDRERWIACLWAPAAARPALFAIHAYDLEQARIVAEAKEPMLGEIRLAWWRERLIAIAAGNPPPGQPILQALAHEARARGVDLAALAELEEGFLPLLLEGPVDALALAQSRGATLFVALAEALAGSTLADADKAVAKAAGATFAMAQLWRGSWGHVSHRFSGLTPPPTPPMSHSPSGWLPGHLRGLLALAKQDLARAGLGKPLAPAASLGRQWCLARAAS